MENNALHVLTEQSRGAPYDFKPPIIARVPIVVNTLKGINAVFRDAGKFGGLYVNGNGSGTGAGAGFLPGKMGSCWGVAGGHETLVSVAFLGRGGGWLLLMMWFGIGDACYVPHEDGAPEVSYFVPRSC
jgi:hypothetical protein